jgi:uncharacterized protein
MRSPEKLPEELHRKYRALQDALGPRLQAGLIVAFSGGTDSAFLLWAAEHVRRESGGRLLAVTAVSASLPEVERRDAEEFSAALGVEHRWEQSGEISNPDYAKNDLTRCYHCKTELFRLSHGIAGSLGFAAIAYGYNASDRSDYRPGHKAAVEQQILSPLSDAELTKDDIRALLRHFDLPLADKPASPCLSSRLMTGVSVTPQKLRAVEELETVVRDGGIRVFRMRLHEHPGGQWLRLEVAADEMAAVLPIRDELLAAAKARGFSWLTLDLAGYRTGGGSAQPVLADARARTS